jgi:hypothetical protein
LAGDALAGTALMAFGLQSSPMIGEAMLKVSTSAWIAGTSAYQAATIAEANIVYGTPNRILPINTYNETASEVTAADYAAQASGQPITFSREMNRQNINANRCAATNGYSTNSITQNHEYPMATTQQGGSGATVTAIGNASHQPHGNLLNNFYNDNNIGQGDYFIHYTGFNRWTNFLPSMPVFLESTVLQFAKSNRYDQ